MSSPEEPSGINQLKPTGGVAGRADNVLQIYNEDGSLALSADEVGLLQAHFVTWPEFLSLSQEELDSLKCVYRTLLKRGKPVAPKTL